MPLSIIVPINNNQISNQLFVIFGCEFTIKLMTMLDMLQNTWLEAQ